jgi:hypothetical protein
VCSSSVHTLNNGTDHPEGKDLRNSGVQQSSRRRAQRIDGPTVVPVQVELGLIALVMPHTNGGNATWV